MKLAAGIGIVAFTIVLFSCGRGGRVQPGIIQEDKMDSLFWELSLAEDYATTYLAKDSARNKNDEILKEYEKVFAIHHVTRDEFRKSYDYYRSRPEIFKKLIDSTNARAQRRRQDLFRNDIKLN
jgi:hypothetical protein